MSFSISLVVIIIIIITIIIIIIIRHYHYLSSLPCILPPHTWYIPVTLYLFYFYQLLPLSLKIHCYHHSWETKRAYIELNGQSLRVEILALPLSKGRIIFVVYWQGELPISEYGTRQILAVNVGFDDIDR
jgi:CDP-diglyceride synthetase